MKFMELSIRMTNDGWQSAPFLHLEREREKKRKGEIEGEEGPPIRKNRRGFRSIDNNPQAA